MVFTDLFLQSGLINDTCVYTMTVYKYQSITSSWFYPEIEGESIYSSDGATIKLAIWKLWKQYVTVGGLSRWIYIELSLESGGL